MMRTALLSVYDKTGIVEFARQLQKEQGFNLLASGGTARALKEAGLNVVDIATIVGDPILDHRVVTLSREIHAALLARDNPEDNAQLAKLGISRIDLVYVNMYPLVAEIENPEHTLESVTEKTDIGGPTMLRSGAKGRRIVMCNPSQIKRVMEHMAWCRFDEGGEMPDKFIDQLIAESEMAVAQYCLESAKYHFGRAAEWCVP